MGTEKGFDFSLKFGGMPGVVGVAGVGKLASSVTLKSLSFSGFGAGEIGRDGGFWTLETAVVTYVGG